MAFRTVGCTGSSGRDEVDGAGCYSNLFSVEYIDLQKPASLGFSLTNMDIWHNGNMAKTKTTLSIDEGLLRQVRVRAARSGKSQSDVLESALREGLGIIDRLRSKARLTEKEAIELASEVVHEVRRSSPRRRKKS